MRIELQPNVITEGTKSMESQELATPVEQFISADDLALRKRVLTPYKDNCQYLKSAIVFSDKSDLYDNKLTSEGEFSIPESCYIDDTGHFNSVEFNICYNQLMYYTIAKSIAEDASEFFSDWDLNMFWRKQLPNILIVGFKSTFRKPVDARTFYGKMQFLRSSNKMGVQYVNTTISFNDNKSGSCNGEVKLAIT